MNSFFVFLFKRRFQRYAVTLWPQLLGCTIFDDFANKSTTVNLHYNYLNPPTMAHSEMVAWECGACTLTIEDVQRLDCLMCMAVRPLRYAIVAGAAGAATARTTTVNRREQVRIAALAADVPAVVAEPAPAVAEEVPAVAEEQPAAPPDDRARTAAVARVVGTMVDIVGTSAEDRGRSCGRHTCCGHQISKGSVVHFVRERMAWRDQGKGVLRCSSVGGYDRERGGGLISICFHFYLSHLTSTINVSEYNKLK